MLKYKCGPHAVGYPSLSLKALTAAIRSPTLNSHNNRLLPLVEA